MRCLVISPGASHSTADVEAGLIFGLEQHGVEVVRHRLDNRLPAAKRRLHAEARRARKTNPLIGMPNLADVVYEAGVPALARALRHEVDVVIAVSSIWLHPDVVVLMKRAGLRVVVVFTESPYDLQPELEMAARVDGGWTNERTCVKDFRAVNPRMGYLPAAWHPQRHTPVDDGNNPDVLTHDVVFVGSGFPSRIDWLEAMDWTGIDLGLYGTWQSVSKHSPLQSFIRGGTIDNTHAAALYRRAKVVLNLYRGSVVVSPQQVIRGDAGESLNPRAYELAACGAFSISEERAEIREVFGDLVPTFRSPRDASALMHAWLANDRGRSDITQQLPACVAESSWLARAAQAIGDVQTLLQRRAA